MEEATVMEEVECRKRMTLRAAQTNLVGGLDF
jgi:hypothetical protein